METIRVTTVGLSVCAAATLLGAGMTQAVADAPCPPDGDLGKCKVLIEINASDGDIGFHFLGDAGGLVSLRISDPDGGKIFENRASGPLRKQKITETFGESDEPLCWPDPEADLEDVEEMVTLREFRERWEPGTYRFRGKEAGGGKVHGKTTLSYDLPAAPKMVGFDGAAITWMAGDDLGHCAPIADEGFGVETVAEVLDIITDPALVPVAAYEVVMVPDVEDDDPIADEEFSVRVSGAGGPAFAVDVPALWLASLPADTPVKMEVGAIGVDDNATFTEADGFCVNEDEGCDEDE